MKTLCSETVNGGLLLLLDLVSCSEINLFRATDPVIKSLKWHFCTMWSNKHGQSQTCWGQAAPSGGQMTLENIFRSHQQLWAFPLFASRYVTLLFVSHQNRFFCCYFLFFFFPNLSGNGLLVAAVAVSIRPDKQRGASIQREMERERERGAQKEVFWALPVQHLYCSLLSTTKTAGRCSPDTDNASAACAQAPMFKIRIRDLWFHLKLLCLLCFRGNVQFSSWPVIKWFCLRTSDAPSAVLESIVINVGSSKATTQI